VLPQHTGVLLLLLLLSLSLSLLLLLLPLLASCRRVDKSDLYS
jgi:hypothetical protein